MIIKHYGTRCFYGLFMAAAFSFGMRILLFPKIDAMVRFI